MWKKSILADLIDNAVNDCYECGSGRRFDEEGLDLIVTADWIECPDPEYSSIMQICIFQGGVVRLSYEDPETKCN